jgi:predicted ester cyclase
MTIQEQNKAIIVRFNKEYVEGNNIDSFNELVSEDFINHTVPQGSPNERSGTLYFFENILKPAFHDLKVEIHDMISEGDKVTSRKTLHGVHKGDFFGVQCTDKIIKLDVIDIIELRDGRYIGHWGILDLYGLITYLKA